MVRDRAYAQCADRRETGQSFEDTCVIAKAYYSWQIEVVDFHLVLPKSSLITKICTYQSLDK